MVHLFVSLQNDKVNHKCMNKRVLRIFKDEYTNFYGDYDFDMFVGTKNDYSCLEFVCEKVISIESGWIKQCKFEKEIIDSSIGLIVSEFCSLQDQTMKKVFPRKESFKVQKIIQYRNDGNFKMFGCETERFYYVFCFATS